MTHIYVAGASAEAELCASWMRRLEAAGHVITLDWTVDVLANRALGVPDDALSWKDRYDYAHADLAAVLAADFLWVIAHASGGCGQRVELGIALGLRETRMQYRPRIAVSGPVRTIFGALVDEYTTHEAAFAAITGAE